MATAIGLEISDRSGLAPSNVLGSAEDLQEWICPSGGS